MAVLSLTFEFENNRKTVRYPTIILYLILISSRSQQTAPPAMAATSYPDSARRHLFLPPDRLGLP